ncbi:MAG: substrate-binding domain-containing protein [Verrucomicrobiae bacterium]|nr:substrate-binding domain-containing protein [Verrucomicrobiae bacterium]
MKPLHTFLLLAAVFGFSACGEKPAEPVQAPAPEPQSKGLIAATCLTLTNPFFKTIQDAMTDEAAKHGYEVLYLSGDNDVAKQRNQIKDFIVRGAAAIAINPCDSKAIGAAIKEANSAGIPVFTFDIKCQDPDAKVVSHIGTNNFQGGQLAAEALIEAIGESGGEVVVLDFPAVESCLERVRGFDEVIGRFNASRPAGEARIEVVARLPGDGNKEKSLRAAEDALQAHPNMIGIFAINDPSGLGAVAALEKAGKQDQVTVIAFDGQPEGKQAIKDGKIYADPIQFPDKIGRETVKSILAYLSGDEVPTDQPIHSALYRKADADQDPELK